MKKQLLVLLCLFMPISIIAQIENSDNQEQTVTPKKLTKYEKFLQETGFFLKFQEYKIPLSIETATRGFWDIRAKIQRIMGIEKYFFIVTVNNEVAEYSAKIEYDDLLEINKVISKLLYEVNDDGKLTPEYLQNQYITDDDFRIGYYIETEDNKIRTKWFVSLDWRKKPILIKKIDDLVNVFQIGQAKIEELKLKYSNK